MWRHERSRWARAEESLEIVGLKGFASVEASQLTYGQQRLLELARSLAGTPKVLLLDEPSAGLNDSETASLQRLLLHVRSAGIPLLVIDHKVDFIDALCDRVVVMELGRVIASGPPHEVWRDPLVVAAYLGVGSSADD
jgi:ABC-type branched-subunit amino acid transport system ATPase component